MATAEFPDRCYTAQVAPFAFGADATPSNIVASARSDGT
jgi:hypothetical protein|eukprot:COSAG06_NODE_2268_length_7202_cov_2.299592_3_plen_39_part_00